MNWTTGTFVAMAGFMAGIVVSGFFIRWLVLIGEAWSQASAAQSGRPQWGHLLLTVASRSLFHSAPWLAIIVVFFAYHVRSEPWAEWLFWGAGASMLFMGTVIINTAYGLFNRNRGNSP